MTTRGMKEEDMDKIAEIIAMVIESEDNVEAGRKMRQNLQQNIRSVKLRFVREGTPEGTGVVPEDTLAFGTQTQRC